MHKKFIGPQLRRLRQSRDQTQGQMAAALGISTSYVNLLEKNERSVSVTVMLKLFEAYGVEWRDFSDDDSAATLADLRAVAQDTLFDSQRPDLPQLRAALAHSPDLAQCFMTLHRAYMAAMDQLQGVAGAQGTAAPLLTTSPEAAVHDCFRRHRNHFPALEAAAEAFWDGAPPAPDDVYGAVKRRLRDHLGLTVRLTPVAEGVAAMREYSPERREVALSEALDHPNRIFQLIHVTALIEEKDRLDALLADLGLTDPASVTRCRVELANYYASAVLMPYGAFLREAEASRYDLDHLATRFGVSFEQACHRATTLQRPGDSGVPFFFLRIDKAGNVTKRFNATDFHLAEHGGACPRLDVHMTFRAPGRILPQFVETPDGSQFFVFSRTVDRPSFARHAQDRRLALAMGCSVEHAGRIGYAETFSVGSMPMTPVGINCRVCPRQGCDQRAHHAVILPHTLDERRRGVTRYA